MSGGQAGRGGGRMREGGMGEGEGGGEWGEKYPEAGSASANKFL